MSFALPSLKVKPGQPTGMNIEEGAFGVPDLMTTGLGKTVTGINSSHPLINSERYYKQNRNQMNMAILRNTQGLHAPLRISMELKATKQPGHLPFLPSFNVMHDSLTGRDLEVGPEDIYGTQEFREVMGQPHAMLEKCLGV